MSGLYNQERESGINRGAVERDQVKSILSPQQTLIFKLSAKGLSDEEVALPLYISPRTVEEHRGVVFKKLGVHTLGEMVIVGVNKGLIDIEECVNEDMKPKLNDLKHLLPREKEVLETMIELQRTNSKVIAAAMNISPRTVGNYTTNLLQKLGLHKIDRALALYMFHQKMQANPQIANSTYPKM